MPPTPKPPPPHSDPTDRQKLTYVAEMCGELRHLIHEPRFRTVAYLLDMARSEAERTAKGMRDKDPTPPPPKP